MYKHDTCEHEENNRDICGHEENNRDICDKAYHLGLPVCLLGSTATDIEVIKPLPKCSRPTSLSNELYRY